MAGHHGPPSLQVPRTTLPPQAESLESETQSRCNPHEARFVAALAAYLLRQGYAPSQLAILTPYCGQQLLIRRELHEQSARARASGGGGGGGGGGNRKTWKSRRARRRAQLLFE